MRKQTLLFLASIFSLCLSAETYTIVFKSGNSAGDSSSRITDLAKIVSEATDNCATGVTAASNIYNAGSGKGVKGGTGSAKGELTIALNTAYQVSRMTSYAAA